ncbi:hypothetical protein KPL71_004234 [Citrus sinensis]|uniref:Uncharacterized protein n=2 Tax=Citrus sinensis TaxID=2711 RepID=A0ACB8N4A7_CITSI|nr:hypothetical protein KPL71_004234 [Citrus sinensis]KDO51852.1 hypothetical protein CISIN_1g034978mg [Citrus sinensis]
MKKCGLFAASVAAASATAISDSSTANLACNSNFQASHEDVSSKKDHENSTKGSSSTEKFAPRFDGLRFIETLVTAHR